jgi:hypothetical protein
MSDQTSDFFDQVSEMDKKDGLLNEKFYTDGAFFRSIEERMTDANATEFYQSVMMDNGVELGIEARKTKNGTKYRYFGLQKFIQRAESIPFFSKIFLRVLVLFPVTDRFLLEEEIRRTIWYATPDFEGYAARKRH